MIDTPAIFTWPLLVAQLTIFGTAAFALMFAPGVLGENRVSRTLWRALATLNLVMSPLLFVEIASRMAQTTWIGVMPFLPEIMRETHAGRFWAWRFVAVVILGIVVWVPFRERIVASGALVLSAILIVLSGLTSHAIDKGVLAVAIYSIHQATAGLWLGALVSLLISATGRADGLEAMTLRVSRVCAWSVAVIAVSGVLNAWRWLGWNLHLLFDSAYGRTLMWKLAIATPALLLGALNRYWQIPGIAQPRVRAQLLRNVAGECILLLAVLAWSAILANTPPPH